MPELKTKATDASVDHFIARIADPRQRADASKVADIMKEVTGSPPRMWGTSIVGFGSCRYAGTKEWFLTGFSPRKQNLTLYLMAGFGGRAPLMRRLGKHKTGKACLYLNSLEDVDLAVLRELIEGSVATMTRVQREPARKTGTRRKAPKSTGQGKKRAKRPTGSGRGRMG